MAGPATTAAKCLNRTLLTSRLLATTLCSTTSAARNMFGLLGRKTKSAIEKKFSWLSAQGILKDFANSKGAPRDLIAALCRIAILGGMKLNKELATEKALKTVPHDHIIIEGVGLTWHFIFNKCLRSDKYQIHDHDEVATLLYGGSELLHDLLQDYVGFEIPKNFSSKYSSPSIDDNLDTLARSILAHRSDKHPVDLMSNMTASFKTMQFISEVIVPIVNAADDLVAFHIENE